MMLTKDMITVWKI